MTLRRALIGVAMLAAVWAAAPFARTLATHTQWVTNANRACLWAGSQRKKLPPANGTTAQLLTVLPKVRSVQIEELRRIQLVSASPADKVLVRGLIGYWTADIAVEQVAYVALKAGHLTAFRQALNRVYRLEQNEDVLLRALGTKCRQI